MTIKVELFPGKRYQYLFVDGNYIASYWGEVTNVIQEDDGRFYIMLDTHGFIHDVDELVFKTGNNSLEDCIEELLKKEVA